MGILESEYLKCFAPTTIRIQLMQMCHGLSNHKNKVDTVTGLSSWFWPSLEDDVASFIDNCELCQEGETKSQMAHDDVGRSLS